MSRLFKFVCLMLIFAVCLGVVQMPVLAAENLVKNPGFEENLYYWEWKNIRMERVTDNPHSGEACAKVEMLKTSARARYAFNYRAGVTYNISIWARVESGTDEGRLIVSHNDLFGTTNKQAPNKVTIGTKWTELTMSFCYEGEDNTGWGYTYVNFGEGKTMTTHYLDDLVITEADTGKVVYHTVPTAKGERVINTGFDKDVNNYLVKDAELSYTQEITHNNTQGAGRVRVIGNNNGVGQTITLTKGKTYRLSSYVKTQGEMTRFKYLIDFANDEDIVPQSTIRQIDNEADGSWSLLQTYYTYTGSKENVEADIYLCAATGKDGLVYYLDDFSVVDANYGSTLRESNPVQTGFPANETGLPRVATKSAVISFLRTPYFSNRAIMCAAKELATALRLSYQEDGNQIIISNGQKVINMKADSRIGICDGKAFMLPEAPSLTENGFDIPAEKLANMLGIESSYDQESKTLILKYN